MKILILTHYFLPHLGGIERIAYEEGRRLVRLGHEVTLLTSRLAGDAAEEEVEGIRVRRIRVLNTMERLGIPWPIFSPTLLTRARSLMHNHDVALSHGHMYFTTVVAGWWRRRLQTPFVLYQHGSFIQYPYLLDLLERTADTLLAKPTLAAADVCLAVSEDASRYLQQLRPGCSPCVLHYGVDQETFHPAEADGERSQLRKQFGLPSDAFIVLFAGRLVPRKGADVLLEAMRQLSDLDKVWLVIAGDGSDRPLVEGIITKHNMSRCLLIGRQPYEKMPPLLRAVDLLALPTISGEGIPLTVMEAMACGVPVVVTAGSGGHVEIVNNGVTGYIVPPSDADRMAGAIRMAYKGGEPFQVMRRRTAEVAAQLFDWDRHVHQLLAHLEEARHVAGR